MNDDVNGWKSNFLCDLCEKYMLKRSEVWIDEHTCIWSVRCQSCGRVKEGKSTTGEPYVFDWGKRSVMGARRVIKRKS